MSCNEGWAGCGLAREFVTPRERLTSLRNWPAAGKIDGSAHITNGRGFVFLFNPTKDPIDAEFALTEECIGLQSRYGQPMHWQAPGESAVAADVRPTAASS